MSVNMAIVHQARVDVRLHMLLWHLAARWGRVRSDGTVLRLRLTHSVLADLVAARRPTVTTALSDLARRGLVKTDGETWVLSGEAPGDLLTLAPAAGGRGHQTAGSPADAH
jgi:CRP-like cAMP-binding protein